MKLLGFLCAFCIHENSAVFTKHAKVKLIVHFRKNEEGWLGRCWWKLFEIPEQNHVELAEAVGASLPRPFCMVNEFEHPGDDVPTVYVDHAHFI
jgi:hypothetical protein